MDRSPLCARAQAIIPGLIRRINILEGEKRDGEEMERLVVGDVGKNLVVARHSCCYDFTIFKNICKNNKVLENICKNDLQLDVTRCNFN